MPPAPSYARLAHVFGVSTVLGFLGGLVGYPGVPPALCIAWGYSYLTVPDKEDVDYL